MKIPIIILVLILIVSACTQEEIEKSEKIVKSTINDSSVQNNKEYISQDIINVTWMLRDLDVTSLKGSEKWADMKGKYVKGLVRIDQIYAEKDGIIPVGYIPLDNEYAFQIGFGELRFDSRYKEELMKLEYNDIIQVEARIKDIDFELSIPIMGDAKLVLK